MEDVGNELFNVKDHYEILQNVQHEVTITSEFHVIISNKQSLQEAKHNGPITMLSPEELNPRNRIHASSIFHKDFKNEINVPVLDERKTSRSLLLASAAFVKFRQNAISRRREKRHLIEGVLSQKNTNHLIITDPKKIGNIDIDKVFEVIACRRITPEFEFEKKTTTSDESDISTTTPSYTTSSLDRFYIQEGPVKLSGATATNERYLFMFNDLLIIAKPKSTSSFKLKERIRMSEVWLANCIDDVTDATVGHDKSFVIGWPTVNHVATFETTEKKELWYNALQKNINKRRDCEEPKEITIKIFNKTQQEETLNNQSCSITVSCKEDSRSIVKSSLEEFQQQSEDSDEYQLFVLGKYNSAGIPLLGHEVPYAIRMNHVRNECAQDENENKCDIGYFDDEQKLHFVLKKIKKGNPKINTDLISQKKWKIKKSPIINWAMNKKTIKPSYIRQEFLPTGKLFRHSLTSLQMEDQKVPQPILEILTELFRRGPSTSGIFRKSALIRTTKQIRQMLDEGKKVTFQDISPVVLASVLKEFFRTLPESLITSEVYENFLNDKSITNLSRKIDVTKTHLQLMPTVHYEVLMRFLCVLYHIQRYSDWNKMTSHNLAICVSPSIFFKQTNNDITSAATDEPEMVAFLIENFLELFSLENEYCLGPEDDIVINDSHYDDSDSGADQLFYKYDDEIDDKEIQENNTDQVITKRLLPSASGRENSGSYSDSSLNANDFEVSKLGNNKLSIPSSYSTKSSPNSPDSSRKINEKCLKYNIFEFCSDEFRENEMIFQRTLLRQPIEKPVLSSNTTSAELIEHKRKTSDPDISLEDSKLSSKMRETKVLPSSSTLIPQKHFISQPVIHHFAQEFQATPNVVFHAFDRRRQPAAPSYEEHIQLSQSKKIIKNPQKQQPKIAHTSIVRHQSFPIIQNKEPEISILEQSLDCYTQSTLALTNYQSIVRTEGREQQYISSMCTSNGKENKIKAIECLENKTRLENDNFDAKHESNHVEDKFDLIMNSLEHNIALNGNYTSRNKSFALDSKSLANLRLVKCNAGDSNVGLEESNMKNDFNSSHSLSPFSLNSTKGIKKSHEPYSKIDDKAKSLVLQKTMLTKAPKKIDQLAFIREGKKDYCQSRQMTARELRRTNRRIRSEVRNAFSDGSFLKLKKPYKQSVYKDSEFKLNTSQNSISDVLKQRYFQNPFDLEDLVEGPSSYRCKIEKSGSLVGNKDNKDFLCTDEQEQTESYV